MWASGGHYDVTRNILNYPDCTSWPRLAASWLLLATRGQRAIEKDAIHLLVRLSFLPGPGQPLKIWSNHLHFLPNPSSPPLRHIHFHSTRGGAALAALLPWLPRPGFQNIPSAAQSQAGARGWVVPAMNLHYREGLQLSCFRF